ncbi:hypothetical protein PCL_07283 [Purpureocillium lilacinum]|uniref:Uncharacterized protein n=1 Tax=Purpureocillium lilacinum TaxID=33203 RepID=A0A2U3DSK8_PURLI|nr:hypothetical protein PCL_07283 [Purpureocillium lilacinum]
MGTSCYHLEVLTNGPRKPNHFHFICFNGLTLKHHRDSPHAHVDGVWLSLPKPKALLHELEAELLAYSPQELVRIANDALHELDSDDWKRPWRRQLFVREDQCNYFVGALQLLELRWEAVLQQGKMTTRRATHSQAAECSISESPTPKAPVPAYSPT